jgi:hypothetical protein
MLLSPMLMNQIAASVKGVKVCEDLKLHYKIFGIAVRNWEIHH